VRSLGTIRLSVILALVAGPSVAGPCKSILAPDAEGEVQHSFAATVVSLDGNATVGFAHDFMAYHPKGERGSDAFGGLTGWWASTGWASTGTTATSQLFSDRFGGDGTQPFAIAKRDLIELAITNEDAPHVRVTLRSWGDVKIGFVADCGPDGMLHGAVIPRTEPAPRTPAPVPTSFLILFRRATCAICG
jgi:hypothetical protein